MASRRSPLCVRVASRGCIHLPHTSDLILAGSGGMFLQHQFPLISCSWSRAFRFQFLSCQYCPALVAPLSPCEALSARWGAATPGHRLHMGAFRSAPHLASYFLTFALPCILKFGTYQLPIVDTDMRGMMWYHFKWMHIFCVIVLLMTSAFERRPPPHIVFGGGR